MACYGLAWSGLVQTCLTWCFQPWHDVASLTWLGLVQPGLAYSCMSQPCLVFLSFALPIIPRFRLFLSSLALLNLAQPILAYYCLALISLAYFSIALHFLARDSQSIIWLSLVEYGLGQLASHLILNPNVYIVCNAFEPLPFEMKVGFCKSFLVQP